ncbi:related to RRN3 - RNA polymerase I specific transcription factor [Melanopsichium pennsylvanicum]|uniref:Related to RRN3 - RNA polymerase I specific transcription factor n=2 Tax=Melanopsichium pennsylvanicum TaxID=63383 RepID=A0AAJ5C3N2_9BASI|nr:related to RRN3-RNA polymerase I specific transcription factor [Melanopsichium pennsylvanicum 4]SNX82757.1 related to RRN3 - RNA polymerase I specific transcription factor [Melanopsichium pennsylvanicum]
MKRASQSSLADINVVPPSPSKRRSSASDESEFSSPSPSTPMKPLRSSLSKKAPPPGSMAAINSLGSTSTNYQGMYLSFVINALSEKEKGNTGSYYELLVQFAEPSTGRSGASISSLRSLLAALSHVVSDLDRSHSKLVESIFALPWTSMDESFAQMWIKFVCSLVSARSEWLSIILTKATKALSYRLEWLPYQFSDETGKRSVSTLKRRQVYERVHLLIRSLLSVVPTLPGVLGPLLVQFLPHKMVHRSDQLVYMRNILHVSEYCAELSEAILGAVIDRAIQLDVEIQVELDEFDDEEAEELGLDFEDPFEQALDDIDDADSSDDDDDSDEGDFADNLSDLSDENYDQNVATDEQKRTQEDLQRSMRRIRESVAKLDAIMIALFEHLRKLDAQYVAGTTSLSFSKANNTPMNADTNRRNLFHTLLSIFARNILPTFRSRHVQFLLFWFNSLDPEFSDFFLGVLLEKSLYSRRVEMGEKEESAVIRSAAAGYVASFVSRASYVDGHTTRVVLYNLCAFLDAHIDESSRTDTELSSAAPGSSTHSVFYSVVQAAFYIFCFRWRDLKTTNDEQGVDDLDYQDADEIGGGMHDSVGSLGQFGAEAWCDGLTSLQRAVTSRLNPLKYCSANVVKQFARIAQHTGFLYCYSIIEANNRSVRGNRSSLVSRSASLNRIHLDNSGSATPMSHDGSDRDTPRPEELEQKSKAVTTASVLESFFPFDPYKLESSASFIEPLYREWSEVAPDEDGDDSSSEEDDDEADDVRRNEAGGGVAIPGSNGKGRNNGEETDDGGTEDDEEEGNSSSFVSQVEAMSISPYL